MPPKADTGTMGYPGETSPVALPTTPLSFSIVLSKKMKHLLFSEALGTRYVQILPETCGLRKRSAQYQGRTAWEVSVDQAFPQDSVTDEKKNKREKTHM